MHVDFSKNYFELFGFDVAFDVDVPLLATRWQDLQRQLHPDNFVSASEPERRFSMQAASFVNEANKVLASPLARAGYLLKLNGVDLDTETDTQMAPEFLMDQMELREEIESIPAASDGYAKIDSVRKMLADREAGISNRFSSAYANTDFAEARDYARQWQFIDKLKREVSDLEADLDDLQ